MPLEDFDFDTEVEEFEEGSSEPEAD